LVFGRTFGPNIRIQPNSDNHIFGTALQSTLHRNFVRGLTPYKTHYQSDCGMSATMWYDSYEINQMYCLAFIWCIFICIFVCIFNYLYVFLWIFNSIMRAEVVMVIACSLIVISVLDDIVCPPVSEKPAKPKGSDESEVDAVSNTKSETNKTNGMQYVFCVCSVRGCSSSRSQLFLSLVSCFRRLETLGSYIAVQLNVQTLSPLCYIWQFTYSA